MPGSLFQALVSIIILLGILYLAYLASRFLGTSAVKRSSSKHIKLLDIMAVGQDKSVAAIRVGSKKFLIGIAQGSITKLADLSEEDIEEMLYDEENSASSQSLPGSFRDILNKVNRDKQVK